MRLLLTNYLVLMKVIILKIHLFTKVSENMRSSADSCRVLPECGVE